MPPTRPPYPSEFAVPNHRACARWSQSCESRNPEEKRVLSSFKYPNQKL